MSAIRRVVLASLVFALLPSALLYSAVENVQYFGGTVKSIPANAMGSLNFDDAKQLQFNYGGTLYKLAYAEITNTDVHRTEIRRFHKIPVPPVVPSHWKDILTISYKNSEGETGTVKFLLTAPDAAAVLQTIAERKAPTGETAATSQNNQWWGDQYWKTTRNKAAWDAQNNQANQAPQPGPGGTK